MHEARTTVLERDVGTAPIERTNDRVTEWRPSTVDRWMLPLMWLAIAIVTAVITPEAVVEPPAAQVVVGEVLGWIGLTAMVGLVLVARVGRSSLPLWSLAVGGVTTIGLAACQMFGHPVFSSTWGLSQVALVSVGVFVSGRSAAKRLG